MNKEDLKEECNECEAMGTNKLDFNDEYLWLCDKHYKEVKSGKL